MPGNSDIPMNTNKFVSVFFDKVVKKAMKEAPTALKILTLSFCATLAACAPSDSTDSDNSSTSESPAELSGIEFSSATYDGPLGKATVDHKNKVAFATSIFYTTSRVVEFQENPYSPATSSSSTKNARSTTQLNNRASFSSTADQSDLSCTESGVHTHTQWTSEDGQSGGHEDVYEDCVTLSLNHLITKNGSIDFIYDLTANTQVTEYDYRVTDLFNGQKSGFALNGTFTCDPAPDDCSYSEAFSYKNIVYKASQLQIEQTDNGDYGFTARAYHESFGYVDLVGESLILCSNGNFQSGTLKATDSTDQQVLTTTFSSCSDRGVALYNGTSFYY